MKLTIVMTNYNRGWYMDRSIFLLSRQTIPQKDWELIVVDDGSADSSDQVIHRYSEMRLIQNFKYVRKKNKRIEYGNPAIAMNIGAKLGTGDLILFTDPEVMMMPDWAENHCRALVGKLGPSSSDRKNCLNDPGCRWDDPIPEQNRRVLGLALCTRDFHGLREPCRGAILGNVFDDYDWFNIEETWARLNGRISEIQTKCAFTDREIRDEFFFHIFSMGGISLSRRLFNNINGVEEDFCDRSKGLDLWAGQDTWMNITMDRQGAECVEEPTCRAVHIHHPVNNHGSNGPAYASRFSEKFPDLNRSNLERDWGLIDKNGFEQIF